MIGVGKTKRGRRYPHHPEHYECVLCGREYSDEAGAVACFDGHDDMMIDLAEVLHQLFCNGRHCRRRCCVDPEHCHCKSGSFGFGQFTFIPAKCGAQFRHWKKTALRVKRFAREHNIPTLMLVKLLHGLST